MVLLIYDLRLVITVSGGKHTLGISHLNISTLKGDFCNTFFGILDCFVNSAKGVTSYFVLLYKLCGTHVTSIILK